MILLTGATGLVGSFILKELVQQNQSVRCITRNRDSEGLGLSGEKEPGTNYIDWRIGDITDPVFLEECLDDIAKVIHCAAVVSYSSKNEQEMYRINVEGTRNIINRSLEHNVEKFVFISSIAAVGSKKDKVLTESAQFDPENFNSYYSYSKYLGELEVWRGQEEGLNCVILNPTIVLGPGDWNKSSTKIFKYVYDQNKYYVGGGYNFLDVRDLAELSVEVLKSDKCAGRYIIAGWNSSYYDLFKMIGNGFGKGYPTVKAGKKLKYLLYLFSSVRAWFSKAEPIITRDAINKSEAMPVIDASRIEKDFPHQYRSIDETIQWACEMLMQKL